jgi:pimeloyl-ACP methyl ester carboxylesterase
VQDQKLTVSSDDGTRIEFWHSGTGPPLLLVHGTTADHTTTWRYVLPELEKLFTVYAMDRRGRGGSGDAPEYHLRREAEDVASVIHSIGEPVNIIGHSYGALCVIEASLLTENIHRMILYEGVPLNGAELYQPDILDRLDHLLQSGDHEGMLITLFRDIVKMPKYEIEMMRTQKAWAVRLANVSTLPRELREETNYRFDPVRFKNMQFPTLLLAGGDSPSREIKHAKGVAGALPRGSVVVMPGQQHAAMYANPEEFVAIAVQFLLE